MLNHQSAWALYHQFIKPSKKINNHTSTDSIVLKGAYHAPNKQQIMMSLCWFSMIWQNHFYNANPLIAFRESALQIVFLAP